MTPRHQPYRPSTDLPQAEAAETEDLLRDGAVAEVRIDGRGNAAVVDVRAP